MTERHLQVVRIELRELFALADLLATSLRQQQAHLKEIMKLPSLIDLQDGPAEARAERNRRHDKLVRLRLQEDLRSWALGRAVLDRAHIISLFFQPSKGAKSSARKRAADLAQEIPAEVREVFEDPSMKAVRNDYEHIDERLDDPRPWTVVGSPLHWRQEAEGKEHTLDLGRILMAMEAIWVAIGDERDYQVVSSLPSSWLPQIEEGPA